MMSPTNDVPVTIVLQPCFNRDCPKSDPYFERDCGHDARVYCRTCGAGTGWITDQIETVAPEQWNRLAAPASAPDYKAAFDELYGHLKWMHNHPALGARHWGVNLGKIATDLIREAHPEWEIPEAPEKGGAA